MPLIPLPCQLHSDGSQLIAIMNLSNNNISHAVCQENPNDVSVTVADTTSASLSL